MGKSGKGAENILQLHPIKRREGDNPRIRRGEKEGSREREGARNKADEAESTDFQISKNHQVNKSLKGSGF